MSLLTEENHDQPNCVWRRKGHLWAAVLNWRSSLTRNRLVINTLYNIVGFGIPFLVSLISTPVLVNRMGNEGYGLWKVAVSALGLMGVMEFGLGTTVAKYVAEYTSQEDREGLSAVITLGFLLDLIVGIALTLPFYFLSPVIAQFFSAETISPDQIQGAIRVVSFGFIPFLLQSSGLGVVRGLQRFEIITIIQTAQNVLMVVAVLVVSILSNSLQLIIISTVIVMWGAGLSSIVVAFRMLHSWEIRFTYSPARLRSMLSFMTFTGLAGLGRRIFNSVDQLAVGAILGLSEVTYYAIAIGIAKHFITLCGFLTTALMPAVSSWYASGDVRKVWRYFKISTCILVLLNTILAGVLFGTSKLFLRLWMGEDFANAALTSYRILIIVYAVMSISAPASQVATGIGVPWVVTVGALGGGIATVASVLVFGRTFGLEGAAWANAGSWIKLLMIVYVGYHLFSRLKSPEEKKGTQSFQAL